MIICQEERFEPFYTTLLLAYFTGAPTRCGIMKKRQEPFKTPAFLEDLNNRIIK